MSEEAFCENLRKRYMNNIIYTYIGQVLVSVNPYKELGLYTDAIMEQNRRVNFYQVPPSVFAIAENAFRSMIAENTDQCILISGGIAAQLCGIEVRSVETVCITQYGSNGSFLLMHYISAWLLSISHARSVGRLPCAVLSSTDCHVQFSAPLAAMYSSQLH
ncbi:Myosin head motor domain [Trinorchestia longiramus]|nr:Myosin head motor domain [Trinorchestia longiramus]